MNTNPDVGPRCGECRLGLGTHDTTDPLCDHHVSDQLSGDPASTRERIPAVAVADFREAWAGLPVTAEQGRYLRWLETWDQPTLNALADVIRLARAEATR